MLLSRDSGVTWARSTRRSRRPRRASSRARWSSSRWPPGSGRCAAAHDGYNPIIGFAEDGKNGADYGDRCRFSKGQLTEWRKALKGPGRSLHTGARAYGGFRKQRPYGRWTRSTRTRGLRPPRGDGRAAVPQRAGAEPATRCSTRDRSVQADRTGCAGGVIAGPPIEEGFGPTRAARRTASRRPTGKLHAARRPERDSRLATRERASR